MDEQRIPATAVLIEQEDDLSLLAKLGAGTGVDAVARAYRSGLVRETDGGPNDITRVDESFGPMLDRTRRGGPGGNAADEDRGVREAEAV